MAEKNKNAAPALDAGSVNAAAESIRAFSKQIGACSELLTAMSEDMGLTAAGFVDMVASVSGACMALSDMRKKTGEVAGAMKASFDSKIIGRFAGAVTKGAEEAGHGISNYRDVINDLKKGVEGIPKKAKESFGNMAENIKNFGRSVKKSFTTIVDSVKNFSLSGMVESIKNLPSSFDSAMGKAGEALSGNAEKIGSLAGSALSLGLTAGIAMAVAAVAALVAAFSHLMKTNESFREKVTEAWDGVKKAFQPAIDALQEFMNILFGATEDDEFTPFVQFILDGVLSITTFMTEAAGTISGIIVDVLSSLTGLMEENGTEIMATADAVWNGILSVISSVWDAVSAVISGVIAVIKEIWNDYGDEIMTGVEALWDFVAGILEGAAEFISGVVDIITGIFTLNGDLIKEGFGKVWSGIKGIFKSGVSYVRTIFSTMWKAIKKTFSPVTSWFRKTFKAAWNAIKSVFSGVGSFFGKMWKTIKSKFTKVGSSVGKAMGGAFKTVVNGIIGLAQKTINSFISGINGAIGIINKLPGVSISHISAVSLPRMAAGGLVEPGQMFIAREAGPELVGSIGSRTAVMNNGQIVEAVSAGVYRAVASAMGGGSDSRPLNITLQVGRTQLGRAVVDSVNALSRVQGSVGLAI